MSELMDSGNRRKFDSGAVRDMADGKGRCDLIPLNVVASISASYGYVDFTYIIEDIYNYMYSGNTKYIISATKLFIENVMKSDFYTSMLEVSKHYEDGCRKYGERNWEKGIPSHSYVDSGIRHLLKYCRGDKDEPHDRAFIWNMLAILWTDENKKDMIDLPFADKV